jgi:hypothetical protein
MKQKIKKTKDEMLCKRFNSEDTAKWQEAANKACGGNLTLWMELRLNYAAYSDLREVDIEETVNVPGLQKWLMNKFSLGTIDCRHDNVITSVNNQGLEILKCLDCLKYL